ncbi:MAG TPA: hypothetical protein VF905_06510, partial [Nitrospirota bacterium]
QHHPKPVVGIRPDRGLCLLNLTQPWSSRKFKKFAIMKALGHADMKTTMICVDVWANRTSGSRWRSWTGSWYLDRRTG